MFLLSVTGWSQANSCDLDGNGVVDVADVQASINMSLAMSPCSANIAGANVCNVIVVQRVVNASMGGSCFTSTGLHSVAVSWNASTSSGVAGYKVYRSTTSNGPYTLVSSVGNVTTFQDNTVQSGVTYYYVVRSVDGSNNESANSNQVQSVIPVP